MKTPAEYQREYRERKKERLETASELTRPYLEKPFFEYFEESPETPGIQLLLDLAGFDWLRFDGDADPKPFDPSMFGDDEITDYVGYERSVGRAEKVAGCLMEAGWILAGMVNAYKKEELSKAIERLGQNLPDDPKERKRTLAELVKLTKLREKLDKSRRFEVPVYQLKQEA